jgi:L,D-transpeptidase ErfK/SrfK
VATGQSSYPTPIGKFEIIVKQRNPWWYPPAGSAWAEGEEPVPPGPGNPLGTRWMGISSPYVGIHGTFNSYSIGYSASHGCVRMLIPEVEWLFERVDVGTPVFIVRG